MGFLPLLSFLAWYSGIVYLSVWSLKSFEAIFFKQKHSFLEVGLFRFRKDKIKYDE